MQPIDGLTNKSLNLADNGLMELFYYVSINKLKITFFIRALFLSSFEVSAL